MPQSTLSYKNDSQTPVSENIFTVSKHRLYMWCNSTHNKLRLRGAVHCFAQFSLSAFLIRIMPKATLLHIQPRKLKEKLTLLILLGKYKKVKKQIL